jgi:hypothetical protein
MAVIRTADNPRCDELLGIEKPAVVIVELCTSPICLLLQPFNISSSIISLQEPEHVIERPIFHDHNNNVIHFSQIALSCALAAVVRRRKT